MEKSRSKHILELSKELLDDIELSRLSGENLLLKASRLARYVGSEEIRNWLSLELKGYNQTDLAIKYMGKTGRWLDRDKKTGFYGPLAQQEAALDSYKIQLQSMSIPSLGGDYAHLAINKVTQSMQGIALNITRLGGIRSRVLALLHEFVANVYYEKIFDSLSESIFESYKKDIDLLIGEICGEIIQQIPAVMDRLSDGDSESVSQALTTCRRIIESFADNIFPASEDTLEIDGNQLSLKADKTLNRINAYVHLNCESKSRKKKIRQNLSNLFDRVSTGVHSEVDVNEAKSLFLNTYLIIGEILSLEK
jgi:hypothetical protein